MASSSTHNSPCGDLALPLAARNSKCFLIALQPLSFRQHNLSNRLVTNCKYQLPWMNTAGSKQSTRKTLPSLAKICKDYTIFT